MSSSTQPAFDVSLLTVCGIEELTAHAERRVTHVLSVLDPGTPEPAALAAFDLRHRLLLRFHDLVEEAPDVILPSRADAAAVLRFGGKVRAHGGGDTHLLVHCHFGISRSTAAMAILLAAFDPSADDEEIMVRLHAVREKAWPNSVLIGHADDLMGRGGRLLAAARRLHAHQLAKRPQVADVMRRLDRGAEIDAARAASPLPGLG